MDGTKKLVKLLYDSAIEEETFNLYDCIFCITKSRKVEYDVVCTVLDSKGSSNKSIVLANSFLSFLMGKNMSDVEVRVSAFVKDDYHCPMTYMSDYADTMDGILLFYKFQRLVVQGSIGCELIHDAILCDT